MVAILKQELVTQGAAAQKAMEDREQIGKSNRQNFDEEIRKERKLSANKRDLLEKALQKEKNAVKGLDKDIAAKATQLRTQEAKITELTEALQKCQDNKAATQNGDVDMLGDEGATDERVKKLQEELAAAQQSALEKGWEIRRNVQALANKDQEIQSRDQQIGHWRAGQTWSKKDLENANRQIAELKKKIENPSEGALHAAYKTIASQAAAIEDLKNKLSRPGTVVADITAQNNALHTRISLLEKDLAEANEMANKAADLYTDNDALKSQLADATRNVHDADLAKKNAELESNVKMMTAENDDLR
jgi:chromosome segregation ATPase